MVIRSPFFRESTSIFPTPFCLRGEASGFKGEKPAHSSQSFTKFTSNDNVLSAPHGALHAVIDAGITAWMLAPGSEG
jgi:hypothetical protein